MVNNILEQQQQIMLMSQKTALKRPSSSSILFGRSWREAKIVDLGHQKKWCSKGATCSFEDDPAKNGNAEEANELDQKDRFIKQIHVQCDRIVHFVHPQRRNDVQSSTKRIR